MSTKKNYILLNDDKTKILNNIHISNDNGSVSISVDKPENLIEIPVDYRWDFVTSSVIPISAAELEAQATRRALIDTAVTEYEAARQRAIDAALSEFNQNYQPPAL
jgi:hypothetical protein